MFTVRESLKHALFNYPCIMPSPFAVARHWFCSAGNGMEWNEQGQLVDWSRKKTSEVMLYDDLDERVEKLDQYSCIKERLDLRIEAERLQRQFVEKNIDLILEEPITEVHFGRECYAGSGFTKGVSIEYSRAFTFPDNIAKDWGDALMQLFNHWLYCLNVEFGPGKTGDETPWWPEEIKTLRTEILKQRSRLFPLINNGVTYEEHCEQSRKWVEEFLKKEKDC